MADVAQTFALNPYAAEQAKNERLQRYAELLQSQGLAPNEKFSYAGIEAPPSAAGALAKGLQLGVSGYLQGRGMRNSEDLANKMTTERKAEMDKIVSALQGTPGAPEVPGSVTATQADVDDREMGPAAANPIALGQQLATGGGMGEGANIGAPAKAAVPGSLDAAYATMMASKFPDLQTAGMSGVAAQARTAGDRAFTLNRDNLQNNFSAAQGGLARAHSDYMADKSQENQEKLQKAQQVFTAAQQAAQQSFTAGENNLNRANTIEAIDRKARVDAPGKLTEAANKLRDDFNGQSPVKNYKEVVPIFASMQDAMKRDNAAADLNIVYGIAKLMDPASVVRESETAMAIKSGSPAEQFQGTFNYILGGGRLTPETRARLFNEARSRAQFHQSAYDDIASQFTQIAKRGGVNPEDVITGLTAPKITVETTTVPGGQLVPRPDGSFDWVPK